MSETTIVKSRFSYSLTKAGELRVKDSTLTQETILPFFPTTPLSDIRSFKKWLTKARFSGEAMLWAQLAQQNTLLTEDTVAFARAMQELGLPPTLSARMALFASAHSNPLALYERFTALGLGLMEYTRGEWSGVTNFELYAILARDVSPEFADALFLELRHDHDALQEAARALSLLSLKLRKSAARLSSEGRYAFLRFLALPDSARAVDTQAAFLELAPRVQDWSTVSASARLFTEARLKSYATHYSYLREYPSFSELTEAELKLFVKLTLAFFKKQYNAWPARTPPLLTGKVLALAVALYGPKLIIRAFQRLEIDTVLSTKNALTFAAVLRFMGEVSEDPALSTMLLLSDNYELEEREGDIPPLTV